MKIEKHIINNDEKVILTAYIQEPSEELKQLAIKPAMLIFPGGGYFFVSEREKEAIALTFLNEGYQCFVLTYSLNEQAVFPRPLEDAEAALKLIKENHETWYLDKDKIAVIGFSAGGHLAATLAGMGRVRPNAVILGYPALLPIPSIGYDHPLPTFDDQTPEMFIFHTVKDELVSVDNALYVADELNKKQIPFELHIFRDGHHGLSLGNQVTATETLKPDDHFNHWVMLSIEWLQRVLKPFK